MIVPKITLDPKDFQILVNYIYDQPVIFAQAEKAIAIKKILESVQSMNIDIKENLAEDKK